ncbi:MAG: amidohydrolase family protein [Victivallales bacterium]|nr:amidohydrolase family protein [Victivallales bacterium]
MIFDCYTATGHWPFRPVENQTLPELRRHLTALGIDGALVASTNAVFYIDPQSGNEELATALAAEKNGYFYGCAGINPLLPRWEEDLRRCVSEWNFRAVRMTPLYHGYDHDGPEADALLEAAGAMDVPVLIPSRLTDFRGAQRLDVMTELWSEPARQAALRHPQTKVILVDASLPYDGEKAPDNLYVEMSRIACSYNGHLPRLIEAIGADHVLFGSGAPLREVEPALLKLGFLELSEADWQLIAAGNAQRLFKL